MAPPSAPGSVPHSMLVIEPQDQKHFDEVVAYAKAIGLYEGEKNDTLKNRLDYLAKYGGKLADGSDKTRVRLFKDAAPYSFGFVIEAKNAKGEWSTWFYGGLLFHGAHDGNGSGAEPTLAVTLTPTVGWVIHT
jgi:hypothetical protein